MSPRYVPFGYRLADVQAQAARIAAEGERRLARARHRLAQVEATNAQLRTYLRLLQAEAAHLEAAVREQPPAVAEPRAQSDPAAVEAAYLKALRDHYRDLQQRTLSGVFDLLRPFLMHDKD